ncbi:bifunctional peptidase and (3S)-lysyl hydroxylase JMJD7-like isoform X2 [Dendronephthya gigantea]|uniref:bifunctional peptidase and (3S)-lysyl hydroxylase JMJD7-like isoform X2 n=1 Tax=Dendronephthya gigantea TaxID=151771 RepID=UPI00106DD124|nr:bifunctional peptidase and (3S)-lysyl hydroxylase JMJD7-like isoform X2 [Dendronephthya gigantea]
MTVSQIQNIQDMAAIYSEGLTLCNRDDRLSKAFISLTSEARELYLPEKIFEFEGAPTPLEFHRNWVCPNIPVIFKNSINHWAALKKWSLPYLREELGGKEKQNGNFIEEFSAIIGDAETDIKWATEAFGKEPDAVNFWMGDHRAITSLHKDHYENLYCVISGQKTFKLYPPTDMPYIPHQNFKVARYNENKSNKFEIISEKSDAIPWIPVDPLNPDYKTYPEFAKAKAVTCTIQEGDVLYLPSLWFHHVQQTQATIAINFWYDMEYDIKYNYFKFIEQLCQ